MRPLGTGAATARARDAVLARARRSGKLGRVGDQDTHTAHRLGARRQARRQGTRQGHTHGRGVCCRGCVGRGAGGGALRARGARASSISRVVSTGWGPQAVIPKLLAIPGRARSGSQRGPARRKHANTNTFARGRRQPAARAPREGGRGGSDFLRGLFCSSLSNQGIDRQLCRHRHAARQPAARPRRAHARHTHTRTRTHMHPGSRRGTHSRPGRQVRRCPQ